MILHIKIYGRVQGVWFRSFVVKQASFYPSLHGWVRNRQNGCVEVLADGNTNDIEKLRKACQKGPILARVDRIEPVTGIDAIVPPIDYSAPFTTEATC